jgi:four helix bundle protein
MHSFEDLEVWKFARIFRNDILKLTNTFPNDEKYKLTDQIIRSSRSVTANIAEGFGRFHHQENIQFCKTARDSLNETLDHLICALDCEYISIENLNLLRASHNHCLKILNGYTSYLKKVKEAM